jgi:hypothetical protein
VGRAHPSVRVACMYGSTVKDKRPPSRYSSTHSSAICTLPRRDTHAWHGERAAGSSADDAGGGCWELFPSSRESSSACGMGWDGMGFTWVSWVSGKSSSSKPMAQHHPSFPSSLPRACPPRSPASEPTTSRYSSSERAVRNQPPRRRGRARPGGSFVGRGAAGRCGAQ